MKCESLNCASGYLWNLYLEKKQEKTGMSKMDINHIMAPGFKHCILNK